MTDTRPDPVLFREHWSDRLIQWIGIIPIPQWLFYLLLFIISGLIANGIGWLDGKNDWGVLQLPYFVFGFWLTGYLALNHFLIVSATIALTDFRSSILFSEEKYQQRLFEFTHIPSRPGNVWSLIGVVLGVAVSLYSTARFTVQIDMPTSGIVIFAGIGSLLFGLAVYRIYHQMRIVVMLFASVESIDLYDLGSIYVLALFPVRVVVVIILTFWVNPFFILFPGALADPLVRLLYAFLSLCTSAAVIIPLRDIIRRLKIEKEELLKENGQQLTWARQELRRLLLAGETSGIQDLQKGIDALFAFRSSIEGISTLPWKQETVRWLATVLLLPLSLLIIQFLLQRYFGG